MPSRCSTPQSSRKLNTFTFLTFAFWIQETSVCKFSAFMLRSIRVFANLRAIRWCKHCNLLITFLLTLKANVYLFTAVGNYTCFPFAFSFLDMSTSTVTTCLSDVLLCFLVSICTKGQSNVICVLWTRRLAELVFCHVSFHALQSSFECSG